MKHDLKRTTLAIILCLVTLFCSALPVFALNDLILYHFRDFDAYLGATYTSNYTVDGGLISCANGSAVLNFILEPDTTYTFYYFEPPYSGNAKFTTSSSDSAKIVSGRRGYLDLDGVFHLEGTYPATSSLLSLNSIPDIDTLCYVQEIVTPSVVNTSLLYATFCVNLSRSSTFDTMNLFMSEGTIEDLSSLLNPTPSMVDRNISVMPGYILVAELCSDGVFSCSSDGLADSPSRFSTRIWETNVQYGQSLTIPSGGTISSSAFLRTVPWTKIDANWLGATNKGQFSTSYNLSDGKYFTVVNPYNWLVEDGGGIKGYHTNVNPVVNCRFSTGVYTYRLYRTSQLWNDVNLIDTSYDRPVFTDNGEAIDHLELIDGVTDEVLDDNVDPADLPIGSMNGSSSTDIDMGYLFGSGNSNADTILDGSRGFFEKLGDFFTFMPAEIRTMIVACFGVTMVVAVLKMFF